MLHRCCLLRNVGGREQARPVLFAEGAAERYRSIMPYETVPWHYPV
jgi:hypothetical protein